MWYGYHVMMIKPAWLTGLLLVRVIGHVLNVHVLVQMGRRFVVLVVSVLLIQIGIISRIRRVNRIISGLRIVVRSIAQTVVGSSSSGYYICWCIILLCSRVIRAACTIRRTWQRVTILSVSVVVVCLLLLWVSWLLKWWIQVHSWAAEVREAWKVWLRERISEFL